MGVSPDGFLLRSRLCRNRSGKDKKTLRTFPQGKVKITTYLLRLSFELRLNMHLIVLNLQESAAILRSTKEQCRNIDSNSMLLMWENFRFPNYPKLSGRPNAMAGMRGNGSTEFPKLPPGLCSDMLRISSALLMLQ